MRPLFIVFLVVLFVAPAFEVRADLYTDTALSLEWLVDSSDEIFLAEVVEDIRTETKHQLVAKENLKQVLSLNRFGIAMHLPFSDDRQRVLFSRNDDDLLLIQYLYGSTRRPQSIVRAAAGDQWLIFVRQNGFSAEHLAYAVNLTQPGECFDYAPVTAAGELLTKKDTILNHVAARIQLKRRVPPGCNRERIDQYSTGIKEWYEQRQEHYLNPMEVAEIRGGFSLPIKNSLSFGTDLWISAAVVPADEKYHQELLTADIDRSPLSLSFLLALLNYPGEKTEHFLREAMVGNYRSEIREIWTYLTYREHLTDPLNNQLVGRWDLQGTHERVELNLMSDHRCIITTIEHSGLRKRVEGRGYWAVKDKRFWIERTEVRAMHWQNGPSWGEHRRSFFSPKQIIEVAPNEIKLEAGPPMMRPKDSAPTP